MKRLLIVNADDCNLTPGVTRAILDCHDSGILTSTTFMINLPVEPRTVKELTLRRHLGVGIHLNVTFGRPVAPAKKVRSLLAPDGSFRKVGNQLSRPPAALELATEYQHQIDLFKKTFGRKPTHLDTHHHLHGHPFFLGVLLRVAGRNALPVRRAEPMLRPAFSTFAVPTTDYFFGNLTPEGYWRAGPLETVLSHLPPGTSEIMCHPGKNDRELRAVSSFREGREEEYRLFRSRAFWQLVRRLALPLGHFGMLG